MQFVLNCLLGLLLVNAHPFTVVHKFSLVKEILPSLR